LSPNAARLLVVAVLVLAASAGARAAEGGEGACLYAPAPPERLVAKDAVADYASVLRTCRAADGREGVAIRAMTIAGAPILLLADPQNLSTRPGRSSRRRSPTRG